MQCFEYMVRSDFHDEAESASRSYGSKERERTKAYNMVLEAALNKMGAQGWDLVNAPDGSSNRNWVFKRPMERKA